MWTHRDDDMKIDRTFVSVWKRVFWFDKCPRQSSQGLMIEADSNLARCLFARPNAFDIEIRHFIGSLLSILLIGWLVASRVKFGHARMKVMDFNNFSPETILVWSH